MADRAGCAAFLSAGPSASQRAFVSLVVRLPENVPWSLGTAADHNLAGLLFPKRGPLGRSALPAEFSMRTSFPTFSSFQPARRCPCFQAAVGRMECSHVARMFLASRSGGARSGSRLTQHEPDRRRPGLAARGAGQRGPDPSGRGPEGVAADSGKKWSRNRTPPTRTGSISVTAFPCQMWGNLPCQLVCWRRGRWKEGGESPGPWLLVFFPLVFLSFSSSLCVAACFFCLSRARCFCRAFPVFFFLLCFFPPPFFLFFARRKDGST